MTARDKQIERARKLFAMSQDSSSPSEAAIADRRLKVLIDEHRITLDEIKGTEPDSSSRHRRDVSRRSSVRRKRTRSTRQRKKPSSFQSKRIIAAIAMCAVAFIFWIIFAGVEETGGLISSVTGGRSVEDASRHIPPSLTTNVERASVVEGESFVLYINGSGLSAMPNTSSLASNFRIVGTQVQESANTNNFTIRMVLEPRQTGVLFIPSFFADGVSSERIILDVVPRK